MNTPPGFIVPDQPLNAQRRIAHADPSLVGAARRATVELGARIPFDEKRVGREALIATELASNLVKHARDGELLVRALGSDRRGGLELLAIDRGPGIPNLAEALRDGVSSAGSPGTGLGAVRRLADEHDIDSRVDQGTVVMARLYAATAARKPRVVSVGVVCQPHPGETLCGDAWDVVHVQHGCRLIVADGLGHGAHAAAAAQTAVAVFHSEPRASPAEVLASAHAAMRATRGAAVFVAEVDRRRGEIRYAGIGNIAAVVLSQGNDRNLVSHNGTVGQEMRKPQQFAVPWPDDALLIVHSDGLGTKWDLGAYPGLAWRHPTIVAGTLYRDFQRGRDDVTVVAVTGKAARWATAS